MHIAWPRGALSAACDARAELCRRAAHTLLHGAVEVLFALEADGESRGFDLGASGDELESVRDADPRQVLMNGSAVDAAKTAVHPRFADLQLIGEMTRDDLVGIADREQLADLLGE